MQNLVDVGRREEGLRRKGIFGDKNYEFFSFLHAKAATAFSAS